MHFTCAARTDVGIVRSGNEDNYLMLAEHGIFIVADGMGGHAAGEVASEMAVRITSQAIGSVRGLTDEEAQRAGTHRNPRRPTMRSSSAPCRSRTNGEWAPLPRCWCSCRSAI